LTREDWARWWTPGRPGRWPDYLLGLDPGWAEELVRLREAWPGPKVTWKHAWTLWSGKEVR